MLAYVQGDYKVNNQWKGNLRLQYFASGGYNSRVYAYESNVLFASSVPAFFDQGIRYYLNLNYKLNKRLSFWTRWAQTLYKKKDGIGSEQDSKGSNQSTYAIQLLYNVNAQ
jgi:hypothetical protein